MKRVIVCLLVIIAQFECISAMYCNIGLTKGQQTLYTQLAEECDVSNLRSCINQGKLESCNFDALEKAVRYAEKATAFVIDSQAKRSENTDEIIVRAMLCRECGSLLASLADILRSEKVLSKVEDASLIERMKAIGLIRLDDRSF